MQEQATAKELEQIDKQIPRRRSALKIAEKDLENHKLQIEKAKQADDFMRDKFTNRELYDWMVRQISAIYFPELSTRLRCRQASGASLPLRARAETTRTSSSSAIGTASKRAC